MMQSTSLTVQDERRLARRAQAGDTQAMRCIIDAHKDRLFAFVSRMVRNHHDAEEICQEAFLKAFAALSSYSEEFRFSTWLFTIAYRVCLNALRKKRGGSDIDISDLDAGDSVSPSRILQSEEAGQLRSAVWAAVDQLSPPQRATVLLFYRQNHSCQDIAAILQVPVATVKSHLHRARARLRDILQTASAEELSQFRNFSEQAV